MSCNDDDDPLVLPAPKMTSTWIDMRIGGAFLDDILEFLLFFSGEAFVLFHGADLGREAFSLNAKTSNRLFEGRHGS